MSTILRDLSVAAMAACIVAVTLTAQASSYEWIDIVDHPADGAVDVPLNPILMFDSEHGTTATELVLRHADGHAVPLTRWDGDCWAHQPTAILDPLTAYTAVVTDVVTDQVSTTTFTTGEAPDTEAPQVDVADAECSDTTIDLTFNGPEDLVLAQFEVELLTYCVTPDHGLLTFSHSEGFDTSTIDSLTFVDRGGNLSDITFQNISDEDHDCYDPWEGYSDNEDQDSHVCGFGSRGCSMTPSRNVQAPTFAALVIGLSLVALRRRNSTR